MSERLACRQTARDFLALLQPQRSRSPPARRRHNATIERQNPIDPALVPSSQRSHNRSNTLPALPALPKLGLLLRRKPDSRYLLHALPPHLSRLEGVAPTR